MQPDHLSEVRFDSLPLHPTLLAGLAKANFTNCTPIQAQTLPLALAGRDIAGQAQTGTGKSAAFLLATMNHLLTHPRKPGDDGKQPRALVAVVGYQELALATRLAAGNTKHYFLFFLAAAALYLVITLLSNVVFGLLESRFRRGQPKTA